MSTPSSAIFIQDIKDDITKEVEKLHHIHKLSSEVEAELKREAELKHAKKHAKRHKQFTRRKGNTIKIKTKGFRNLTVKQTKSLRKLQKGKLGVLKPSDKNMGPAISTSEKYKGGSWEHLSDVRTYLELTQEEKEDFCKGQ